MTTVQCGKKAALDISEVYPGEGESWVTGDPVIFWGDGIQTDNVAGTTIWHTYSDIGLYNIQLEGRNSCDETCSSSEAIVVLENPHNLITTDITKTSARISWDSLAGRDTYHIELYENAQCIISTDTTNAHYDISNLSPNTSYSAYVSAVVSSYESEEYCGNNTKQFTTLIDECEMPLCSFMAE